MRATKAIAPAIEIIDSRILDWKFKFEDTVADNGSSAGAIIGTPLEVPSLEELSNISIVARKMGKFLIKVLVARLWEIQRLQLLG